MKAEAMTDNRVRRVSGRAIPLPGNDVDTDRIIPARFMKCVTFADLGKYAFYDARFNEDGSPKDHPFNDPRFQGGSILVVNRNFGCGSSREHAPQSLMRAGIHALIGESFAEIFSDNCTALGLPLATAPKTDIEALMRIVRDDPRASLTLDLEKKEVRAGTASFAVQVPEQSRQALLDGSWDSTAELLSAQDSIKQVAEHLPYLNGFRLPK